MLQQYLACSSQYAPVQQAFSEVMKAEEMHRQALAEVWQTAVPLTGLLVSKASHAREGVCSFSFSFLC